MLRSGIRIRPLPKMRKKLALKLVKEYVASLAEAARQLGVSTSGLAQSLRREMSL
jgi:putative transposase